MNTKVLIIDDEDVFREDLASLLRNRGFACETASNAAEGIERTSEFDPDVVFCDVVMPDSKELQALNGVLQVKPDCPVIMITAYGNLDSAVAAFRLGAADYLLKPIIIEDAVKKIERLVHCRRTDRELRILRREVSRSRESAAIIGSSAEMRQVMKLVSKVAETRSTVLITGESGTGKELVARAIHDTSDGASHPFIAINCAGIPEQLLESELFGHVRGAFTGAVKNREGFFELAGEGSILLDEIGEMQLGLQGKLLRVLEQREFYRIGGGRSVTVHARVIASTNKDLKSMVDLGEFREDLYYRIAVFEIPVPPLRERRSDIPELIEHFRNLFNAELKRACHGVNSEALKRLMVHDWKGNVREMKNVLERAMIMSENDRVGVDDLPSDISGGYRFPKTGDSLRESVLAYEREHIRRVLEESGGNRELAAKRLGINPSTLYRKIADTDASA